MDSIMNGIMVVLFIIFMVFIFGGYHKTKSAEREAQYKKDEEKANKLKNDEAK